MRVLILSAFLACAAAAPSLQVPILPFIPSPTLFRAPIAAAIPLAVPTISPGDIQAAAIDAQVKAEDQAREFADRARELAEQAVENQNEGVMEANDLAKEKSEQALWNTEEQKWQALDAAQIAEAQAQAAAARTSYIPYVEPAVVAESSAAEEAMPVAKAAETPAATAPEAAAETPAADAVEAPKPEEAIVKMAELEKPAETEAVKSSDSVQIESADIKAAAPEPAKIETQNPLLIQTLPQGAVLASSLSSRALPLAYSQPLVAPVVYFPPGLRAVGSPAIHPVQGAFVAPHILQPQW